jgi:threonine/homoserine/homoserine lactone efflux protein
VPAALAEAVVGLFRTILIPGIMDKIAFLMYVAFTVITPGPNNLMSMMNAERFGLVKSLPFNLGIFCGFFFIMALSALFTGTLYELMPQVTPVMVWVGAAYILWLAYVVARDKPRSARELMESNSFLAGLLLQFMNVKIMLYGLTAFSAFILPHYSGVATIVAFALFLAAAGCSANLLWAAAGAVFRRFFALYRRPFNWVMAASLVYCAAALLLQPLPA